MKIITDHGEIEIDDEALLEWMMGELLYAQQFLNLKNNVTVVHERGGVFQPRHVKLQINSMVDVLKVGPLLKMEPMTYFTFEFPRLKAEAQMKLHISSPTKVDIEITGKGVPGFRSGKYSSMTEEVNLLYKKCWEGSNIPQLYSLTCGDLLRLMKNKKQTFIQTEDFNWPMFCGVMAKLVSCIAIAEGTRCLLMLPITVMELQLGKKGKKGLSPITDYSGSSADLIILNNHYEAKVRKTQVPGLTSGANTLKASMLEVVRAWIQEVLSSSKKRGQYDERVRMICGGKQHLALSLPMMMINVKILNHLSKLLVVDVNSMEEGLVKDTQVEDIDM